MMLMLCIMATHASSDRRRTPRLHLGNLVAEVDLHDGNERLVVCIWDASLGGACLMVPPDLKLPDAFELYVDGLRYPVQRVWHRWCYVGVKLQLASLHGVADAAYPPPDIIFRQSSF